MNILVTGAGGFLGGYLVGRLLDDGHTVRAVSRRPLDQWTQYWADALNMQADLCDPAACASAVTGMEQVYHLAALIGGIGFLESNHADCTHAVVPTSNLLRAAAKATGVKRFLFPSSACVYPDTGEAWGEPLCEDDVRPYDPRGGYGWAKLFGERMCAFYAEQYGLEVRIPRLGTVYGPHSPVGSNEKAPIALCRKVISAKRAWRGELEIWGDGEQTRSFLYVEDAIAGLIAVMNGDYAGPINIGSEWRVTINALADEIEVIAGTRLKRVYLPDAPRGVRGRVASTFLARTLLGWRETTPLKFGLRRTYVWMEQRHDG